MEKLEKAIKYNSLLRIYGKLLSETQREFATSYFEYDLSLSEIAENSNVSRSAVEDAIKKSMIKLDDLESNLQIQKNLSLLKEHKDLSKDDLDKYIERILDSYGI